jgi:hypothetical protein
MIKITGWLAAGAIVAAMALPAVPAQAAAQRSTTIEKAAPTEISSARRWHRRYSYHQPYRYYGYRYPAYRPYYYSHYRPYPFYGIPFPFGLMW